MKIVTVLAIVLAVVAESFAQFPDVTLTKCKFNKQPNRYCENDGYQVAPESVKNKWASGITGTQIAGTGPDNSNFYPADFYYIYFQGTASNVPSTALMTPVIDVTGISTVCVSFDYVMFGNDLDKLYVVGEFSDFGTVGDLTPDFNTQVILIKDQTADTRDWVKNEKRTININGQTSLQVKFVITVKPGDIEFADTALDSVAVAPGNCPGSSATYSDWTEVGTCSAECGGGLILERRTCLSGVCTEPLERSVVCNTQECVSGQGVWGDWMEEGECDVTCGGGKLARVRTCGYPIGVEIAQRIPCLSNGVPDTDNVEMDEVDCNTNNCPTDLIGQWADWELILTTCSETCGDGNLFYRRDCNYPPEVTNPTNEQRCKSDTGVINLQDTDFRTEACNNGPCQVLVGQWGDWEATSTICPVTCGFGFLVEERRCMYPPEITSPTNEQRCKSDAGIVDPDDTESRTVACNAGTCPVVVGQWADWELILTTCSETCGDGNLFYRRDCNYPPEVTNPTNEQRCKSDTGVINLQDTDFRTEACNNGPCQVLVGQWGDWEFTSTICPVSCGGSFLVEERRCLYPPEITNPTNEQRCKSDAGIVDPDDTESRAVSCNAGTCPVLVGQWGDWEQIFTTCSETCGDGNLFSKRECNYPPEVTSPTDEQRCKSDAGIVDPNDTEFRTEACNDGPCQGVYNEWSNWSVCSNECGVGFTSRNRTCSTNTCTGNSLESKVCESDAKCPENGGWTEWMIIEGECPVTCEGPVVEWSRECKDPAPLHGGAECRKLNNETGVLEIKVEHCNPQECDRDGGFSLWTTWTACETSCNLDEFTSRFRQCDSPTPKGNGKPCNGSAFETKACNLSPCEVDGNWTMWSTWSECSHTCDEGFVTQTRNCTNPSPSVNGRPCEGDDINIKPCDVQIACPVDGKWSTWGEWEACSQTCNSGMQTARRACDNPEPAKNGKPCEGESSKNRTCFNRPCPAEYFEWGQWGECSKTCGNGTELRTRQCIVNGACSGPNVEEQTRNCSSGCRLETCPATAPGKCDCNFERECPGWAIGSHVEHWQIGHTTFTQSTGPDRDHTFPEGCGNFAFFEASNPLAGGVKAYLASGMKEITETKQCLSFYFNKFSTYPSFIGTLSVEVLKDNYLHTVWTHIGAQDINTPENWEHVNIEIDYAIGDQTFLVFSAAKKFSYGYNSDMAIDDVTLVDGACSGPVDGFWEQWGPWSQCAVSCGDGGFMQRSRVCDAPENDGEDCVGDKQQTTACIDNPACPVDGEWSEWSPPTTCSATCGEGTNVRTRECANPRPEGGGRNCLVDGAEHPTQEHVEELNCEIMKCPTHGNWSMWTNWADDECSVSCGGGEQTRNRLCNNPLPDNGGDDCLAASGQKEKQEIESRECNTEECPIPGNWGEWQEDACSLECGGGLREKTRQCNNPQPEHGGQECLIDGSTTDYGPTDTVAEACNTHECRVDGVWGEWNPIGVCNQTCGTGIQAEFRVCTPPSGGGDDCIGNTGTDTQTRHITPCNTDPCPVDGMYGDWTEWECSVTCGDGEQTRSRECNNPAPDHGGAECVGATAESAPCSAEICQWDGTWSEWQLFGTCTLTCGGGKQKERRTCSPPVGGGADCVGHDGTGFAERDASDCNTQECPVDGTWNDWTEWSMDVCNPCGLDELERNRVCTGRVGTGARCLNSDLEEADIETQNKPCFIAHCTDANDCNFEGTGTGSQCNFVFPSVRSRWFINSGETRTPNTGPIVDHTIGTTAGHYMYAETSKRHESNDLFPENIARAELENLAAHTNVRCMRFYMHVNATSDSEVFGTFKITRETGGVEIDVLLDLEAPVYHEWKLIEVNIPAVAVTHKLVIESETDTFQLDKAIDDVKFYDVECAKVDDPLA